MQATSVSVLLLSFLSVAILICFVKYVWKRRWLYYHSAKLDGPFSLPVVGCAYLVTGGEAVFLDRLMKIVEKYHSTSTTSKLWMGPNLCILTTEPKDIEKVLNNSLTKPWLYSFMKEGLGDSLILSPVNIWKPHRKVINLTFHQKVLNSFFNIFVGHANILEEKLDECGGDDYVDVLPITIETTLHLICETTMGIKVKDLEGANQYINEMTRAQRISTIRVFQFWLYFDFIWKLSSLSKEFTSICTNVWKFVEGIVETRRKEKMAAATLVDDNLGDDSTKHKQKIFLDFLIDIKDKEETWTNREVMEEAQLMVIAGSETTAVVESSVLVMLAMHQDVQYKAYKEIFEIFGNSERALQPEDLSRMVYLEMIIKETLRLFPVLSHILRTVDTDVKLKECIAPKGSTIFVPSVFIQRCPKFWNDPLKFDPERFLPDEIKKRHRYVYLPFGAGPRDCVGKRYAMMSMKVMLSMILRRFRMVSAEYKSVADIEMKMDIVTKMKNGYKVKMERRCTNSS